jgi:glycosyltransferase involved in cell wall biosynthesis
MPPSEPSWLSVGRQSAAAVARPFVRFRSPEASPGCIARRPAPALPVRLSVVIPTLDGYRNGYLSHLLAQIERQDFKAHEVLVVRGDPRQGRAINIGAALAQGDYLLTLDDDTQLPDPATFGQLVGVMEAHVDIGMAGGNNLIPEDASPLVRRVMQEIPRRSWPMVEEITDSDLAEHPCLIMRTAEFKAIGGENELIPRGLDPYLRREFRKADKRVVVVPGVFYHHLPPPKLILLLKQFYRNGRDAAFVNCRYPDWVIETPATHGDFKDRVDPTYRVFRFGFRLIRALTSGYLIWFASELFYAIGYLSQRFQPKVSA